jgi:hypothetical protein
MCATAAATARGVGAYEIGLGARHWQPCRAAKDYWLSIFRYTLQ